MTPEELEEKIDEFHSWPYRFDFENGVSTPVPDARLVIRQRERRRYFFEPLVRSFGGSLRGRRILDLGCSAGLWSLEAVREGAEYVLGLDTDATALAQAQLVFQASGVDPARYRFEQADVLSAPAEGRFDAVLCLGLLNRIDRPLELFEVMAAAEPSVIVVETELVRSDSSVFELTDGADGRRATERRMVLVPSRDAVTRLAAGHEYQAAVLAPNMEDYTGLDDYRSGRRRAFFCARDPTFLQGLEVERAGLPLKDRLASMLPIHRGLAAAIVPRPPRRLAPT